MSTLSKEGIQDQGTILTTLSISSVIIRAILITMLFILGIIVGRTAISYVTGFVLESPPLPKWMRLENGVWTFGMAEDREKVSGILNVIESIGETGGELGGTSGYIREGRRYEDRSSSASDRGSNDEFRSQNRESRLDMPFEGAGITTKPSFPSRELPSGYNYSLDTGGIPDFGLYRLKDNKYEELFPGKAVYFRTEKVSLNGNPIGPQISSDSPGL